MRRALLLLPLAIAGLTGMVIAVVGFAAGPPAPASLPYHAVLPAMSKAEPTPTPTATPRPAPYLGPVASIYLGSARIYGASPMETGGTHYDSGQGRDVLDDPTHPYTIMYYPGVAGLVPAPGLPAGNTVMAAHVNYVNYGNGPFAYLLDAQPGDALYVTMANGTQYTYTVRSVELVPLDTLDMDAVFFPPLDSYTERVTLISCGGTFIPAASGYGGAYNSRIILVAERYVS